MFSQIPYQSFDSLCDFINGGAWSEEEYVESGLPVLKVSNFRDNQFTLDDISFLTEESAKKYAKHKLTKNDLIIATVGSHPNLVNSAAGRTIRVTDDTINYYLNQNAVCLRVKDSSQMNQVYLAYLGQTDEFRQYIQVRGKGAASQMRIAIGDIKSFPIKLIPIETQEKIASILLSYDDLIENNLKRIKLLEEIAQITYEEWFVRMKFPGHETTVFDEETGLPEGWEIDKLGSLLAKVPKSRKLKADEYQNQGKYPVIDQSRSFIAGYTDDEETMLELESAIVFGDHTRIVKFINFKFARGADGTQILLSNDNRVPQHLLYQLVQAIDLSDYHYARHFKYLKDTDVVIPSDIVAQKYEIKAKCYFDQILLLRNQIDLLKEARDILLPRLMTGMVDIEQVELPKAMLQRLEQQKYEMTEV
jgi:type I restriction enzyme S subunit